ncbi:V-type ATP synthase subunit I [Anaerostipes sp. MSJ-23]|uniref:V-type ATP synthase subunit I n=2 Tax=unclassified Anaerostipes TaxID=2635253 RepID=UPI001C1048C3|nr:V-type ATPase 116kDa subunit family protein [Anaerostipes sp. MSJ-23]MBU5459938.1 ATPase [Anaerostipes sp. MSJ-23]
MIVKMKFLSISGPRTDIDRVSSKYLSKYEMQLENAITELKTTDNLLPFMDLNPYKEPLAKAEQYVAMLPDPSVPMDTSLSEDEIINMIRDLNHDYLDLKSKEEKLKKQKEELLEKYHELEPFQPLELNLKEVFQYRYMKVRFGRIAVDYYQKLEKYLFDDLNAIFLEGTRDENYVYGCYFSAHKETGKIDSAFRSLHFEKMDVPEDYEGMPAEICRSLKRRMELLDQQSEDLQKQIGEFLSGHAAKLLGARYLLEEMSNNFDVRKMAARLENEQEDYYILCGWMSEDDVKAFIEETKDDDRITIVEEEGREKFFGEPPTKLKNPKFFKPFEMFIRMYGLPSHNEMDPTIFVALTYTFIFGAMFGDVGQGLCLFIGGGILYKTKKMNLAGIISIAGIFSTFFGFMFGSFFGFEGTIIKPLWLSPMHAMINLPFVGQLNTVFIVAVAFGMGLILLAMIFQIINAKKRGDKENMLFGPNGVAGLVFYGFLVLTIVLYMTGHKTPGNIMLAIFLGIPVILFFLKEPLGQLVEGKKPKTESGVGMFFVQGFFELFETMLSFFSNTISFVRIGAFAVSHAAMMEVVLMLGGITDGAGTPNWIVIVLGNIIVCALEGLVVGIQVLRLEYYEMFSRFYQGSGREFHPFNNHANKLN